MSYLVFGFGPYYPGGGANDLFSCHTDFEAAKVAADAMYERNRIARGKYWEPDDYGLQVLQVDGDKAKVVYSLGYAAD